MSSSSAGVTATLPGFVSLSEFWTHNGDCGPDAALMILHALYGSPALTGPSLDAVVADMHAHGLCDANGVSSLSGIASYCKNVRGVNCYEADPYGSSVDKIHQTLLDHAGRDGIVLQVTAAHNLLDNEAGVSSHFVAIGGISPQGYLVGNGDDVLGLNANHGHGTTYAARWMSWADLLSAQPAGTIVFPNPKNGATSVALPANWKDDGTKLSNPTNGNVVVMGFREYILAHEWESGDVPLENEHPAGSGADLGTAQLFTNSGLRYVKATAALGRDNIGQQLMDARAALAKATTPPPAALTDAQKAAIAAAVDALGKEQDALAAKDDAAQALGSALDGLKAAFGS